MHIQTHILSGWCAGNLLPLTARERLFCMIAASVEDIDGLGILISQDLYWDYHHRLGHSIPFGVMIAGLMTVRSRHRLLCFPLYLLLFHLHLGMDLLGSGEGWKIHYYWPFSDVGYAITWGWNLYSWQNITAFVVLFAWTIFIARRKRRTPLELLMPSLDRKLTNRKTEPAALASNAP